jgi:ribosome-associated toxin RatA of RatAB toxin-antitoxin module
LAELTTEHTFDAGIEDVFDGIGRFKRYPDYIPGVTGIEVLPPKKPGSTGQVRYELKIVKSFYYTLNMYEERPGRMWWDLDESNIMKKSSGSWTLKDLGGGKTKAIYALDVAFKGLVPSAIVDQITKANLPGMFKGFQELIDANRTGR